VVEAECEIDDSDTIEWAGGKDKIYTSSYDET